MDGIPLRQEVVDSYSVTRDRFATPAAAAKYAERHGNARDRREQRCLQAALAGIPRGSTVLDLPCGTGRLTPLLIAQGFQVTGADSSAHMVAQAQAAWGNLCRQTGAEQSRATFHVADIMATGYADDQFDVVICNRLFHHFTQPFIRRAALEELRRICRHRVIVSFFNSFAVDAVRLRLKDWWRGRSALDRVPISLRQFASEALEAGLTLHRAIPTRWCISPQWYAVFLPSR